MSPPKTETQLEDQPDQTLSRQRRLLSFFMSKKVPPVPSEDERTPYAEYHSNPISQSMFWWLNPILSVGYKRTITSKDLFVLEKDQKTGYLYPIFKEHFDNEVEKAIHKYLAKKAKTDGKIYNPTDKYTEADLEEFSIPTLLIPLCLYKTMTREYNMGILYKALCDGANSTTPLVQKKLIEFVENKALGIETTAGKGVGYAIACCFLIFISSITLNHSFYHLQLVGAKSRAILTRLLMDKSLTVNAKGIHLFQASKIQSMISTDLNRIDLAIGFFPFLLTTFIPLSIGIGLLLWNIGVSALVGIAVFFSIILFLGFCMKPLINIRKNASIFTDLRVNLMKELLKNYKMIKFYSWENSYSERIQNARFSEMKHVLHLQSLRNVITAFAFSMQVLASMATFCTAFEISSGKNAADVFSSLSLFGVVALEFILVPISIAMTADMVVSMKKMSKFMSCNDADPSEFFIEQVKDDVLAFKIEDGDFEWDTFDDLDVESEYEEHEGSKKKKKYKKDKKKKPKKDTPPSENDESSSIINDKQSDPLEKTAFSGLHNINIQIKKGEFIVVTGSIGSGKSSLLNAMAGLMKRTNGKVSVDGDMLLCGYPWVQNATIRDNITFGLPYDEAKYHEVVSACSLYSDFDQFPGGDMTEVGERGITLSGGQKARINLARAVYADKDIILLDDVLSAVDAKVGKQIIDECIMGILKDKTRVMATHQLGLIDTADRMIFLNGDGTIDIGTIKELKARNDKLMNLLQFQMDTKSDTENKDTYDSDLEIDEKEKEELIEQKLKIVRTQTKAKSEIVENKFADNDIVRIVGDEEKAVNALGFSIYWDYCKLAFGKFPIFSPLLFFTFAVLNTFCEFFTNTWLSFWVEEKFDGRSTSFYMGLYIMFAILFPITLAVFLFLTGFYTNKAAKMLNFQAAQKILHVPMSFMDVSPIGRVLNRFTKDTDVLDNEILEQLTQFLNPLCSVIGTIILCIIYIPWFAIAVPLIIIVYVILANYYQASAREIKRIEAVNRSLVYSHFNEVLSGRDTISAYHIQETVKDKLNHLIDTQNEAYFITIVNQRWLGANLGILALAIVFLIAMLCVFSVFNISASSTGLILTYVINMTGLLSMMMRAMTQVENEFNSVERLDHYAFHLAQEAAYEIPENDPVESWPQHGEIAFKNVNMKYRPELPYVLKNLNIHINKGEKIGFCGRTGAGKSTFMTCLYRLTEFEGDIDIDGVDIKQLGLHKLRSKLTIIPQDPVLFVGTIRENLDPFKDNSDDNLWEALCISGLIKRENLATVKAQSKDDENLHKFHLTRLVEDDGTNFSIGERQLIALARALVRKTKILILDEATSSVDYETDSKIQQTITSEFSDCTILCIAHRLNTILKYDRIVVLDQGEVIEFDSPKNLFTNKTGHFRAMCDRANITIDDF